MSMRWKPGVGVVWESSIQQHIRATHNDFNSRVHVFRFYEDGSESGSTAIAEESTNINRTITADNQIQLRYGIDEDGAGTQSGASTDDWGLEFDIDGGGFNPVTASSTGVRADTGSTLSDGGATTDRATEGITDGGGTFQAGEQEAGNGEITDFQLTADGFTEHVWGLILDFDDLADGNVIQFRVTLNGSSTVDIDNNVTPQITITKTGGDTSEDEFPGTLVGWPNPLPKPVLPIAAYPMLFHVPAFIPVLDQYRIQTRTEPGAFFSAADTVAELALDSAAAIFYGGNTEGHGFGLRVRVQETGGVEGATTDDWKLQARLNGTGGYLDLGIAVQVEAAIHGFVEGSATTERLAAGSGSFVAGEQSVDGIVDDFQLTAGNYTELLFGARGRFLDNNDGDFHEFRLLLNGVPIAQTVTPRVNWNAINVDGNAFRFYEDGTEAGATAIAAQNSNITRDDTDAAERQVQLRLRLQETAGQGDCNTIAGLAGSWTQYELQRQINAGSWDRVTASSTGVILDTGSALTDQAQTTNRLTGGTGTFRAGETWTSNARAQMHEQLQRNDFGEIVWGLLLVDADLVVDDTIQFRFRRRINGGGNEAQAFTYTNTVVPTITIGVAAATDDTEFAGTQAEIVQPYSMIAKKTPVAYGAKPGAGRS